MLRTGKQIRLTRREIERFTKITVFEPEGIRCLADLDAYVKRCMHYYWCVSADTQFLHWLIEKEYQGCLEKSVR